jgi:hypothetical protein
MMNRTTGACAHPGSVQAPAATVPPDRARASARYEALPTGRAPPCPRKGVRDAAFHPCLPVPACRAPTSHSGRSGRGVGRGRRRRRPGPQRGSDQCGAVRLTPGGSRSRWPSTSPTTGVEASVLDHGPEAPAALPADADTDEPRAGGRGLWLLRRLVEEVRLERVKLGTRVTLRRAIGPAGTLARKLLPRHA